MSPQSRRDEAKVIAASVNDVAFGLYRELAARDNMIFSPLGVYCVLRMLYEGARGETREALLRLLRRESHSADPAPLLRPLLDELESLTQLTEDEIRALEASAEERRRLEARGEWDETRALFLGTATAEDLRLDLRIASAIWIQTGYAIDPGFMAALRAMMEADVTSLDFASNPARSCDAINSWVAERTHGRIETMLAHIPPLTRAIVGNALYFKARWQDEFGEPKPSHFYLLDGTQVQVQMMAGHFSDLNHIRGNDFWAVELPYYGTSVSMVLMVPAHPGGSAFSSLERDLARRWTEALDRPATATAAVLTMPQFKVQASRELAATLSRLGLGSVFGPGADFSGVSGEPGVHVSEILHNTYLTVDRYGTEAAAATLAVVYGAALQPPPKPIVLRIDRPFLFAVVDRTSGVILSLGKVENPG